MFRPELGAAGDDSLRQFTVSRSLQRVAALINWCRPFVDSPFYCTKEDKLCNCLHTRWSLYSFQLVGLLTRLVLQVELFYKNHFKKEPSSRLLFVIAEAMVCRRLTMLCLCLVSVIVRHCQPMQVDLNAKLQNNQARKGKISCFIWV